MIQACIAYPPGMPDPTIVLSLYAAGRNDCGGLPRGNPPHIAARSVLEGLATTPAEAKRQEASAQQRKRRGFRHVDGEVGGERGGSRPARG